ncbi:hypothetical protein BS47DRAFT_1275643, partial [Hydnum rufescens UP504]
ILFLPPYSPDFTPIEEAFSAFKAWLHQHNMLVQDAMSKKDGGRMIVALLCYVFFQISGSDAAGWF